VAVDLHENGSTARMTFDLFGGLFCSSQSLHLPSLRTMTCTQQALIVTAWVDDWDRSISNGTALFPAYPKNSWVKREDKRVTLQPLHQLIHLGGGNGFCAGSLPPPTPVFA
jgi:hypothetical protein